MEAELLKDVTFFNGILNDTKLKVTDGKPKKSEGKTSRKSTTANPATKGKRTSKSPLKENLIPDDTENKKPKRVSKKGERQPLKALNTGTKSQKKDGGVSPKKKPAASPGKKRISVKPTLSPKQGKQTLPKIIVHQDTPKKGTKERKQKRESGLSKSFDDLQGTTKTRKRSLPKRRSLNDLTTIKTPSKKDEAKGKTEKGNKSPVKGKPKLPKLKPGQPEFEGTFAKLETLFPNVDPEFMRSQFVKLKGSLPEIIEYLIIKEKTNELPTRDEFVRRSETESLQNKFWENFSVENFLKIIPDPWEHFLKTHRHNCGNYVEHSFHFLKNKYKKHYVQAIQSALKKTGNSLYLANKELKKKNRLLKMRATNRSKYECDAGKPTAFNMQFVLEVAFVENESKIRSHIKKTETAKYKKFKEAEKAGALLQCKSCNDFSLLPDDAVNCPANHVFCKDCVVKYVEIEMERNNFTFKCLTKCEERFSMDSLQAVLSPFLVAQIVKRNQLEEIKSAGIEDLVFCPFCYYVAILPPEMSVFKCLNPGCMMESCRSCQELSHIPLKCHELEKLDKTLLDVDADVEEEKEEEILKCMHCNGEFLKREDSEQMVCPCGATICSICQQPFPGCPHHNPPKSPHRLSSSSDDTDYAELNEDDLQSSASLQQFIEFLPSDSEVF